MRLRDWTLQYNLIWAANEKPPTDCICPDGYEPYTEECRKVTTKPATKPADWNPMLLIEKTYQYYADLGLKAYNSDYNMEGSMTDSSKYTFYAPADLSYYWYRASSFFPGPMNRCALWTESYFSNQSIGFSVCVNIGETKTYLIGIGVDNYISMRIDGTYIINMSPIEEGRTFRYWNIYPVTIKKGFHVIEVIGSNVQSIAAVGIQIYDATISELLAVSSDSALAPYLVFDSADERGNLHSLGDEAYPIDPDYALVMCDGDAYYRKVEYTPCTY